jgi:hypothetical protein
MRTVAVLAVLAVIGSGPAWSCSIAGGAVFKMLDALRDKRLAQADDCSFVNGGNADEWIGSASVDQGNSRVSQNQYRVHPATNEVLGLDGIYLTDCNSAETVVIFGAPAGEAPCAGPVYSLDGLLAPEGPLTLREGANLTELAETYERVGVYLGDAEDYTWALRPRNRVNFFCGCRIHYPESNAAKE